MRFKAPETTGIIQGVGDYAGLEAIVRIRPIALGFILDLQRRQGSEDPADVRAAYHDFGDQVLVSWNLDDASGDAVPPTGDGLLTQDPALVKEIVAGWIEAVTNPPPQSSAAPEPGLTHESAIPQPATSLRGS